MASDITERGDTCCWCGAELRDSVASGERRVRCARCGAETTFPVPSAVELDEAYADWYRPREGRFSGPGDRVLRKLRGRLAVRLDEIAPLGPVFDVGSGDGALIEALRSRGREAAGSERLDEESDGPKLEDGSWAAIVFWHSLEHLPDAGERVRALPGQLMPGGVVVITVPNPTSLQARAFGDRWLALDLPRHLVHIPAATLVAGVEEAGLVVERVSFLRGGQIVFGWLHGFVGMLPTHPDLYDCIRQAPARRRRVSPIGRTAALAAAIALLPLAVIAAAVEVIARRGGTVYLEARNE